MSKSGTLYIKIRSDVEPIRSGVLVEVRDSSLRLLELGGNYSQVDLPLGLYEVSVVLEDGKKYCQYAKVEEGITTAVTLQVEEEALEELINLPSVTGHGFDDDGLQPRSSKAKTSVKAKSSSAKSISAELLEVDGAIELYQTSSTWHFQAQSNAQRVATALIRLNKQQFLISLPVCSTHVGNSSCSVKVEQQGDRIVVNAWISPDQYEASAMQNMLGSGFFLEAAGVAENAIELLQGKYSDPVGAALGALIMHKTGQLYRRKSWVENLAQDFSWLPDGKVMLVSLLLGDESERERALKLAVAASKQQMLFTENFSLLLGLLRRWPRGSDTEKIQNAIEAMASRSPFLDWESICLSYMVPEEE